MSAQTTSSSQAPPMIEMTSCFIAGQERLAISRRHCQRLIFMECSLKRYLPFHNQIRYKFLATMEHWGRARDVAKNLKTSPGSHSVASSLNLRSKNFIEML